MRIRRGLYATVPPGIAPSQVVVDPFLLVSKLADDAIVAYHAALQFYGKSYSVWRRFHYLTDRHRRPVGFGGDELLPVPTPAALRSAADRGGEIETLAYGGGNVRVTSLERALVDCFHVPGRGGGWEEVWRSLEMVELFDIDRVVEYALRLGSAVTVARVGVFLEQHREELVIEDTRLAELRCAKPDILERRWEETP